MRLTRRGRLTVTLTVVALLTVSVAYLLLERSPVAERIGLSPGPPCHLTVGQDDVGWSVEEAMTATTVAGVGTRIGATVNGVAAAVARSLDPEPTVALTQPQAREIYRALPDVAQPRPRAVQVAEALLGHQGRGLSCTVPAPGSDLLAEAEGAVGLTPRADAVRLEMRAVFGKQILGGFEAGGVENGHINGSAHYEGRAIDVFFRPVSVANKRLGWQQAMWAVAHARRLSVATVIFDRAVWSGQRSDAGWRDYSYPGGATDNPVLLHEDHVHVDVLEGLAESG